MCHLHLVGERSERNVGEFGSMTNCCIDGDSRIKTPGFEVFNAKRTKRFLVEILGLHSQ